MCNPLLCKLMVAYPLCLLEGKKREIMHNSGTMNTDKPTTSRGGSIRERKMALQQDVSLSFLTTVVCNCILPLFHLSSCRFI